MLTASEVRCASQQIARGIIEDIDGVNVLPCLSTIIDKLIMRRRICRPEGVLLGGQRAADLSEIMIVDRSIALSALEITSNRSVMRRPKALLRQPPSLFFCVRL